jgi:outer membrane protein assembly factor BamA
VRWTTYSADYRRYDAILFSFLTFATRVAANVSVGPDETQFPKYIGRPDFVRGYDRELYASAECGTSAADPTLCSATQLLGSRVAYANAELRFPLVRRFDLGLLPMSLPPVDGLFFYDFGMAWSGAVAEPHAARTATTSRRSATRCAATASASASTCSTSRCIRWDYSIPLDAASRKGYWFWTLGQSF